MRHWILFAILHCLLAGITIGSADSSVTAKSLITEAGYPYEEHEVQTSDGYILGIHRIPYSSRVNTSSPRPVVLLMHGIFAASTDWLLLGPDYALAYVLSDEGYDVWLSNTRGNRFSRKHVTLNPRSKKFWHFSWFDIGTVDIPDTIDYIGNLTGEEQVHYIGHSEGVNTFLVGTSLSQELNNRIKSAHLLGPTAFMGHTRLPFAHLGALIFGQPNPFVEITGDFGLLLNPLPISELCSDSSPIQFACSLGDYLLDSYDLGNLNRTILPKILSTLPNGASVDQVYQYFQVIRTGRFCRFDLGRIRNQWRYGTPELQEYPLKNITAPIFLYYSQDDKYADPRDVKMLMDELPESTLRGSYEVPYPKWSHIDFVYSTYAKEEVYDKILADIASSS